MRAVRFEEEGLSADAVAFCYMRIPYLEDQLPTISTPQTPIQVEPIPKDLSFPAAARNTLTSFILSFSSHLSRKRTADPVLDFFANSTSIIIVFLNELSTALKASANQDVPFERLVAELLPGARDLSRNPLAQVTFAVHSQRNLGYLRLDGLKTQPIGQVSTSRFDLEFHFFEEDHGMRPFSVPHSLRCCCLLLGTAGVVPSSFCEKVSYADLLSAASSIALRSVARFTSVSASTSSPISSLICEAYTFLQHKHAFPIRCLWLWYFCN